MFALSIGKKGYVIMERGGMVLSMSSPLVFYFNLVGIIELSLGCRLRQVGSSAFH